jgi:hypothetical protein
MKFLENLTAFLFLVAMLAIFSVLLAYPTKWSVNYLLEPAVLYSLFGGPLILGKAWVLNFLASSLFKNNSSFKETAR